jgi:hypothetical protein
VKNFTKQATLFIISFLVIFLAAAGMRFLFLRVEWARNLPPKPETALTLLIAAAHWALSLALFSSILFSLSYSIRKKYSMIMSIILVMCLSFLFCFGTSFFLENWRSVPAAQSAPLPLGDKGIILSNSLNRNETAAILLNGTADPLGPRVAVIPGQPMIFYESASVNFDLPPVPFKDDIPWFLKSISIDVRLNAEIFNKKFTEDFFSFSVYAGSLIFLLCSLGIAFKFSAWPLANLFLGILAFRAVLAVETFLNTPEIQEIIDSFLNGMIPITMAVPFIFLATGLLLCLYSFLAFAVKRRNVDDF